MSNLQGNIVVNIPEEDLGQKSTLGMTDYVRVVGSDGISYKQGLDDVSDKIITEHNDTQLGGVAQSVKQAIDTLDNSVGSLQSDNVQTQIRIDSLQAAVGTPLVASTVAGMTDHDKIYVYVGSESGYTNGHWYYWDGSAWADGGVYNSTAFETDKTLTLSDRAADAKVTGDEIADVRSDLITDIYNITGNKIIEFNHKKAYIPITTTADISNPIPNANYECVAIPCSAGDTFIVSASGATPWGFIDSNNAVLTKAAANSTVINGKLIAPSTAAYLVCNNNKSVFDGVIIKADILLTDDVSDLWDVADELTLTTNNFFNLSGATDGYLLNTGNDNPTANADWFYTDYLPVNPNTAYGVSRPCYVNYYDVGKVFKGECTITPITASWGKFTTPNNASFIRISAKITDKSTAELVIGETKPTEYLPYGRILNGNLFKNNSIPKTKVQGFGNLPYVTVEPNGNGDYTTISDAVVDVSEGTTILVMPGDYEESIKTQSKTVYIVGVDKYKCRVWNSTGDYDNPPFYFASGCLKNLTIENVYDSSKDYSSVLGRPNGEYAIHIDTYPVNKTMQIDNCIIKSVWGNVFGCGARNGEVLEISNCLIIADKCELSQNMCQGFNMHGGSEGDSADVYFKNNVFINTHNDEDIKFSVSPSTQSQNIKVHAYFNIASNVVNASPSFVHIQSDSYGNQSSVLNYSI